MKKIAVSTVFETLSQFRDFYQGSSNDASFDNEEPFHSELYSSEKLDRHARTIAKTHKLLAKSHTRDHLLTRLDDNEETLLKVRTLLADSIKAGTAITPGGEWLLDNFYLIEEQVALARKHLPKGYSEELPYLANGLSSKLPRVYNIVLEIISHSDGRVDLKNLSSFIEAYQTRTVLTLGELWAMPIMLRLAVIENLRRVCGKIALDMIDHNLAEYWTDRIIDTAKEESGDLFLTISDLARAKPELSSPFVAAFIKNLQGKGPTFSLPLNWLEQQLGKLGLQSSELVRQENQKQAVDQVSVRNSIGTLRFIGASDWRQFVESLSHVEQVLRRDPAGVYSLMDFATRDKYRHVVEEISKRTNLSEPEVALKVLGLAESPENGGSQAPKRRHIGYYLIDKGLSQTNILTGRKHSLKQKILNTLGRKVLLIYLLSIIVMTAVGTAGMHYMGGGDINSIWLHALFLIVCAAGAIQLAISLVNWLSTIVVTPELLPSMDFSKGIPANYRTLVVVPTMLAGESYIEELIEGLEIRFLANKDPHLHFALLTDFMDERSETLPTDNALVELASRLITELNQKYKQTEDDIFFLFHRPRTWNKGEQKWMGHERKRGKLAALNALLRGHAPQQFSVITGNHEILTTVKYVITLDSDTQLPRETAWKFVATMAHLLNHPVYDTQKERVTEGYGILQPRVETFNPQGVTSLYMRMQGDLSGIDPYTHVSSDVYQDLFGQGSFIGKGIYDIDIFEQSLADKLPENRILSHDLLEGCYSRAGLLSNVFLYEDNPARYSTNMKRQHRWIRGDWQIGLWILPFVARHSEGWAKNRLSTLSKWKIFDNLRRSLLPLSLLLLLLLGWFVLPQPGFWTLVVTIIVLLPVLIISAWHLVHKPIDLALKAHLSEVAVSIQHTLVRFIFGLAILPYEAYMYTDAIVRTLWRLLVSGKRLLEWTPSANADKGSTHGLASAYRTIWIAPLSAILCVVFLYSNLPALYVASPILFLWFIAPALVWVLSKPETNELPDLPEEQTLFLHTTARKTWAFFERFVTAEDNWLPPDNFQEDPVGIIAHRTSPTNMGLALLANLSAYDFGYITSRALTLRCKNTLSSMLALERFRGHLYNWYDTASLQPLNPKYVSTVDSGNLVGHLLTLKQGLLSLPAQRIFSARAVEGLSTTVRVVRDTSEKQHAELVNRMISRLAAADGDDTTLRRAKEDLDDIISLINEWRLATEEEKEVTSWTSRLLIQAEGLRDDLELLAPWLAAMPVPDRFIHLKSLDIIPSLQMIKDMPAQYLHYIAEYEQQDVNASEKEWLSSIRTHIITSAQIASVRIALTEELADQCEELSEIEYDFLFDTQTSLLRIGYNVDEQRKDNSFYDLLASEARLGVFVGIAQGKLPQESWFSLGRLLTNSGGDPILLSWSGSMFEYLMPQLVMPSYESTLLEQTSRATVKRQIEYARQQRIPWGISESAYNMVDAGSNYQYRAFGVPGLGLKRGLEDDLVIAPYASMLALMVMPGKACSNLQLLSREGFEGEFGFFEAIDYTASRVGRGKTHSVIRSYMAHHQGMGLLSLAYQLLNKPMQQRFVAELRFQATLLLLQERVPRATVYYAHTTEVNQTYNTTTDIQIRSIDTPNTTIPEIQLLSNGRYHVMISNSGGGYSRWKDIAVTRWREDATKDNHGIFCYIKDVHSGQVWSNTYHPTGSQGRKYEVVFSHGHVEFLRLDHGIDTRTEIVVSPEDDTEMRRVRITNKSQAIRTLEITSYAEVVLARQASDEAHPAFSNLFVQTEIVPEYNAVICTRRPRSAEECPPWMVHVMNVHGAVVEAISYDTDRMQFIGRSRTLANPQAMDTGLLSGSQGSVLDPIVATRYRILLKPGQMATVDLIYAIAETRDACEELMHKYSDRHLKNRAFELSWTHNQVLLRQINAGEADAHLYDRLAASVIYANPAFRADASVILNNYKGQSGLWSHSVSGDLPIVLLHLYAPENLVLVRQMLQAHAYWRLKGLAVDLVIWNEDHGSYRQVLQDQILGLITSEAGNVSQNSPGNVFVRSADQVSPEDRILFESVSRVIISDSNGTLSEQVHNLHVDKILPSLLDTRPVETKEQGMEASLPDNLMFFNGTGGFTPDGKEYKIIVKSGETTPAPWANVIANPHFGSVVSESGSAYTWAINAHEYRITPWSNDPVSDIGGEAVYLRNEETGHFWSPVPFPAGGDSPYIATHGFGYTTFSHIEHGICTEISVFVDKSLPVKFIRLRIVNQSGLPCTLSATGFLEIILGDVRSKTNMHILSEYDDNTKSLLFRNRYNTAFADRVSFFRVDEADKWSFTTDRAEFIGRNGGLKAPQAMYRKKLSGRHGAAMDTCAAIQVKFELEDTEEKEIVFQMGSEESHSKAHALIQKISGHEAAVTSLQVVKEYWEDVLCTVQIATPDAALDVLANGWLTYQTLVCRIYARSGFYQSGGAFGFRDQLQDVLSLLHTRPLIAREQILLHASKQFPEGDVLHWWHPPEGRGVRTHCSDDLLWLPYAVSRYIAVTGDIAILNISVGYIEARLLHQGEESLYDLPATGNLNGTLYEHCVKAIQYSLQFGKHGLPLIGAGDWNDGMDRVGDKGLGESVWLAFFLYDILLKFAPVATAHGDDIFAETCRDKARILQEHIETSGWDGEWYRRAYFDDGTPLGSRENEECRIDAIAQSWSVLSGAGNAGRARTAMESLDKYLVKRDLKIIQLLDPPFDSEGLNPGYIKGYVPGVRENGGQYSHAAIWALMAFAALGDREKVWELFSMIHPVGHALDRKGSEVYKAEPYVMAADVYANESHKGRGGWTWYTGSSGWMYQFVLSSLLGMELSGGELTFNPCFPLDWPFVSITYRYKKAVYRVKLFQLTDGSDSRWSVDGKAGTGNTLALVDSDDIHEVEMYVSH